MERFEEWFAVRIAHKDEQTWPSRIIYDPQEGISLNAINFADPNLWYSHPTFEAETITGYLDYQRRATVIDPFIQAANPGSIGADAQFTRARYRVVANGILKNIHLEKLSDRCFTGLRVQLPSFHAWISPQLVRADFAIQGGLPSMGVEIGKSYRKEILLTSGVRAEILVYASADDDLEDLPVKQHTRLSLTFPKAVDYETVINIDAALDTMFGFLVGTRLKASVVYLPTTHTRRWNNEDTPVTSEAWLMPAWKRLPNAPHKNSRMFIESNSPIETEALLNICVSRL